MLAEPQRWTSHAASPPIPTPFDGERCDKNGQLLCRIKCHALRWCVKTQASQVLQRDGHVIKMMMQDESIVSGHINEQGHLQWSDGDIFYRLQKTPLPPLQPGPQPNFPPPSLATEPIEKLTKESDGDIFYRLDEAPPPPLQPLPQPNFPPPSLAAEPIEKLTKEQTVGALRAVQTAAKQAAHAEPIETLTKKQTAVAVVASQTAKRQAASMVSSADDGQATLQNSVESNVKAKPPPLILLARRAAEAKAEAKAKAALVHRPLPSPARR